MKDIIFLPGLGCDQRLFEYQSNALNDTYNCKTIVCDAVDNMKDHVNSILDHISDNAILVGHSFGGWVAQWVAIQAPERVSRLILIATGPGQLTPELETIFKEMKQFFVKNKAMEFFDKIRSYTVHPSRQTDIDLMNKIRLMQEAFSLDGLINQVNTDLEAKDTTDYLKDIQCDVLLVHGKQDPFYEQEMWALKNSIPKSEIVEVDYCGHMVPLEKPEILSLLIQHWLK